MANDSTALTDVVDELKDASEGKDTVDVGQLIDALDQRGYGPALAVLPLIELTPLGGIPGFPTALALLVGTIALRMLLGYEHFWAPGWLRKRSMDSDKVLKSVEWLRPVSQWIDDKLQARLSRIAGPAGQKVACVVILALCFAVPPLEVVPFATSAPMIVISIFGLALLYRDGLLMLLGFIGAGIAAFAGVSYFLGS
ncbi:exopolysaccharide biosynthesis protein [Sulfitobacter sp. 1A15299]|uniref:exopolysaccharide biosynthesis protein n=1 Tax=Sulfitobacter sp. 1A15299 TaxID=3368598 RepID=UPI003745FC3E